MLMLMLLTTSVEEMMMMMMMTMMMMMMMMMGSILPFSGAEPTSQLEPGGLKYPPPAPGFVPSQGLSACAPNTCQR